MDDLEEIRRKKKREMLVRMSGNSESDDVEYPEEPLELADDSIEAATKKYPLLVVDCWAPWCGPCRMIAPVVEQLAKKYQGKIVFGKLNVDHNQKTAVKYQIMSIPALLVFKGGKQVDTVIGAMPAAALEKKLVAHL
jgi:thioredoxin 1